jgi:hypothetical protein
MGTLISPKYPSMERQDLTQGQLGSFKFTPVDIEQRNNRFGETPLLWQAQAKLRARLEQHSVLEGVAWDNKFSHKNRNRYSGTKESPYGPLSHANAKFINDYIESDTKMDAVELRSPVVAGSPERLHYGYQANVSHSLLRIILETIYLTRNPAFSSISSSTSFAPHEIDNESRSQCLRSEYVLIRLRS